MYWTLKKLKSSYASKYDSLMSNVFSFAVKLEGYCAKCEQEVKTHCGDVEHIVYKFVLYFDNIKKEDLKNGRYKPYYTPIGILTDEQMANLLPDAQEKCKDMLIIDIFLENLDSDKFGYNF